MKTSLLLPLLFLLQNDCAIAQTCKTYDCALQQAKAAFEAKDFRKAYEGFKAAKNFKRSDTKEVDIWMDKTFDALEKQLATLTENQAEADKKKATTIPNHPYFYKDRFGLAHNKVERFSFIDKEGNTLIEFKYDKLGLFDDLGFARATIKDYSSEDGNYLIDTSGNEYRLATELYQLDSNTTALDLRQHRLSSFPAEVLNYIQLEVILLSDNHLTSLPDSFTTLTNLHTLCLNDNQLTVLLP